MSSSTTSNAESPAPSEAGGDPKPGAASDRLRQLFEHANRSLSKGDYDYAHDLFAQCVAGDPSAVAYVQHFRANLAQLHPELSQPGSAKKSGAFGLPGRGGVGRGSVAKAAGKGEWAEAFTAGCQTLRKSPADTVTLREMADACGELGHPDTQLYYLRWAMDLAPTDSDINRRAAAVLEKQNEFDQAIGCWARVLQEKPADEEAKKAVARLSVEKTIDHGGYDPALLSNDVDEAAAATPRTVAAIAARNPANADHSAPPPLPTEPPPAAAETEERLRAAIEANPDSADAYIALAEHCEEFGRLQDAERLYRKAYELGGDLAVLVRLEEVYLRLMRERSAAATRRAEKQPEPEALKAAKRAFDEAARAEVEVFSARVDRSPEDPTLRYDLGIRLKRVGRYREAIGPLQAARADEGRLAETHLHLGECFQHIGQHLLAMRSYRDSLAVCGGSTWSDLRKLACYRGGVLALGMKDLATAETMLTDLAAADFEYRDVAERLDKLARIREAT